MFIRAPWIESAGHGVEVLAEIEGHPVVSRQGNVLVAAFHPELTDDLRLHAYFLALVARRRERAERMEGSTRRSACSHPRRVLRDVGRGDVCLVQGERRPSRCCSPMYQEVLKRGGFPVVDLSMEGQAPTFFKHASDEQLDGCRRPQSGVPRKPTPGSG